MDINANYLNGISTQLLKKMLELNEIALLVSIHGYNERTKAINKILKGRKHNG